MGRPKKIKTDEVKEEIIASEAKLEKELDVVESNVEDKAEAKVKKPRKTKKAKEEDVKEQLKHRLKII